MFTSSVTSTPSTPTYSAPTTNAVPSAPSIFSTETAGSVACTSSNFSIIA